MLAVIQFPIADVRGFGPQAPTRLPLPDWPDPEAPQFVRRFGPAIERGGTRGRGWNDERLGCSASRAIAFADLSVLGRLAVGSSVPYRPVYAFRRLAVDESGVVVRVEMGITNVSRRGHFYTTEDGILVLAQTLAAMPTHVPASDSNRRPAVLAGQSLARLYERSTTYKAISPPIRGPWLVEDREPIILIQLQKDEWASSARKARRFRRVPSGGVDGADLRFARIQTERGHLGVWLLSQGTATKQSLRALRICLLRFHAERECLNSVLHQLRRGTVRYDDPDADCNRLDEYLNLSTHRIGRNKTAQFSQFMIAAYEATVFFHDADADAELAARLSGARREVARKTEEYARRLRQLKIYPVWQVNLGVGEVVNSPNNEGTVAIGNTGTNVVVKSTGTNANALVAQSMDNVLNEFRQSEATDELKAAVASLHDEAARLIERLSDDEQARDVGERVRIITEQAKAEHPLAGIIRDAAKGILSAAAAISDLASPVTTALKAVLSLLHVSLE